MPLISTFDGTRVFHEAHGSGPAVVFLPGINLSHEVWSREVTSLTDCHRVITVDLRGHGMSDKPVGDYSYGVHAEDMDAVLDAHEVDRAVLIGWSFGGGVALRYAATRSHRVSGLVLVGAAVPRYTEADDWPSGVPTDVARERLAGEVHDNPRFRKSVLESAFHSLPSKETLEWLWTLSMRTPMWASLACREALLVEDLRPDLKRVECPTLLIHGRRDRHVPLAGAELANGLIPDSRILILDETGHVPHLEEPDKFGEALRGFLQELSVDSERPDRWAAPGGPSEG